MGKGGINIWLWPAPNIKWKFGGKNSDSDNSFEKCVLLAVGKGIIKKETVLRLAEELQRVKQ